MLHAIADDNEHPYGDATTAGEERFERQREERTFHLSSTALKWAEKNLRTEIAYARIERSIFFSFDWSYYYHLALNFGLHDLAEELKDNH